MNSDPALIRVFLAWLRLMDVTDDRLVFRLQIHESGDAAGAVRFWADVVGVPSADISTTLKRHNPRTVRKNTGDDYHGAWPSTSGAAPSSTCGSRVGSPGWRRLRPAPSAEIP